MLLILTLGNNIKNTKHDNSNNNNSGRHGAFTLSNPGSMALPDPGVLMICLSLSLLLLLV